MKECTETGKPGSDPRGTVGPKADKPLVSIVMATYNPRMDWLKEQLTSLEKQTYRPLELIVLDDCSSTVSLDAIRDCVEDCIHSIPYRIFQNEENAGSTKTFEQLTLLADGEYIAYCDQDDVWHEDKIETCQLILKHSDALLAFSDMKIIDGTGSFVADSITKVRRHHQFQSGENLGRSLLFKNFVTGCTMMIRRSEAQSAVPFCPYMVHDHWLALYCAVKGEIRFIKQPLVDYRIHESNQTLMLAGVTDKCSYLKIRIEEPLKRYLWLQERFGEGTDLSATINQAIKWMEARRDNFIRKGRPVRIIWNYRKFSSQTSLFEIATPYMPEKLFMFFIGLARKNIV